MSLTPVSSETFGGLDLIHDPGEAGWGQAIDLLNVEFRPGRVKSRFGWTVFSDAGIGCNRIFGFQNRAQSARIIVYSTSLFVYNTSGTLLSTGGSPGGRTCRPAVISSPTATYAAIPHGNASAVMDFYEGGATSGAAGVWSAPAASPICNVAGTQLPDERLVAGDVTTGGTRHPSRVQFSDAGDPLTWGANNYVDLGPNFSDPITAIDRWENLLIVFQPSCFHVFYGNATDSSGNPIFSYRTVDTGVGCVPNDATARSPEGLYFVGRDGIYVTTGGSPEKISEALDPFFLGHLGENNFSNITARQVSASPMSETLVYWRGRLIYTYDQLSSSVANQFVYDSYTRTWSYWNMGGNPMTVVGSADLPTRCYMTLKSGAGSGTGSFGGAETTDNGTAITSRYRSGFADLGSSDIKRIHSWRLQGSGTPTLKLSTDFGSLETGAALTLGTSPAVAEATRRYAPRGRQFSYELSGTSAWSVNNLVANVAGKRRTGEHVTT